MPMTLPGWDSIDAAARYHRAFEIAGFVALGLLLLFEVLAYIYGNRKDALVAVADQTAARETVGLHLELERDLQKRSPRTLTNEQKATLTSELKGKTSKVTFVVQKDLESRWFALQLSIAFQDAGAGLSMVDMAPGESFPVPAGVMMYKPGGATSEQELKDDPLYIALKKANLFGGYAAEPFVSPERGPTGPMLPLDGYVVYVGQKLP